MELTEDMVILTIDEARSLGSFISANIDPLLNETARDDDGIDYMADILNVYKKCRRAMDK